MGNQTRPSKTASTLKARYQDFMYALKLVCHEIGGVYKGRDCTCGECKKFFKDNPLYIDKIREGLLANWGPNTNRKDRRANLFQDILVGRGKEMLEEKKLSNIGTYTGAKFVIVSTWPLADILINL